MNSDVVEELTWATVRQREEEARAARPHTDRRPHGAPFRSRLARTLVHAGLHLDGKAGELADAHRETPAGA